MYLGRKFFWNGLWLNYFLFDKELLQKETSKFAICDCDVLKKVGSVYISIHHIAGPFAVGCNPRSSHIGHRESF